MGLYYKQVDPVERCVSGCKHVSGAEVKMAVKTLHSTFVVESLALNSSSLTLYLSPADNPTLIV